MAANVTQFLPNLSSSAGDSRMDITCAATTSHQSVVGGPSPGCGTDATLAVVTSLSHSTLRSELLPSPDGMDMTCTTVTAPHLHVNRNLLSTAHMLNLTSFMTHTGSDSMNETCAGLSHQFLNAGIGDDRATNEENGVLPFLASLSLPPFTSNGPQVGTNSVRASCLKLDERSTLPKDINDFPISESPNLLEVPTMLGQTVQEESHMNVTALSGSMPKLAEWSARCHQTVLEESHMNLTAMTGPASKLTDLADGPAKSSQLVLGNSHMDITAVTVGFNVASLGGVGKVSAGVTRHEDLATGGYCASISNTTAERDWRTAETETARLSCYLNAQSQSCVVARSVDEALVTCSIAPVQILNKQFDKSLEHGVGSERITLSPHPGDTVFDGTQMQETCRGLCEDLEELAVDAQASAAEDESPLESEDVPVLERTGFFRIRNQGSSDSFVEDLADDSACPGEPLPVVQQEALPGEATFVSSLASNVALHSTMVGDMGNTVQVKLKANLANASEALPVQEGVSLNTEIPRALLSATLSLEPENDVFVNMEIQKAPLALSEKDVNLEDAGQLLFCKYVECAELPSQTGTIAIPSPNFCPEMEQETSLAKPAGGKSEENLTLPSESRGLGTNRSFAGDHLSSESPAAIFSGAGNVPLPHNVKMTSSMTHLEPANTHTDPLQNSNISLATELEVEVYCASQMNAKGTATSPATPMNEHFPVVGEKVSIDVSLPLHSECAKDKSIHSLLLDVDRATPALCGASSEKGWVHMSDSMSLKRISRAGVSGLFESAVGSKADVAQETRAVADRIVPIEMESGLAVWETTKKDVADFGRNEPKGTAEAVGEGAVKKACSLSPTLGNVTTPREQLMCSRSEVFASIKTSSFKLDSASKTLPIANVSSLRLLDDIFSPKEPPEKTPKGASTSRIEGIAGSVEAQGPKPTARNTMTDDTFRKGDGSRSNEVSAMKESRTVFSIPSAAAIGQSSVDKVNKGHQLSSATFTVWQKRDMSTKVGGLQRPSATFVVPQDGSEKSNAKRTLSNFDSSNVSPTSPLKKVVRSLNKKPDVRSPGFICIGATKGHAKSKKKLVFTGVGKLHDGSFESLKNTSPPFLLDHNFSRDTSGIFQKCGASMLEDPSINMTLGAIPSLSFYSSSKSQCRSGLKKISATPQERSTSATPSPVASPVTREVVQSSKKCKKSNKKTAGSKPIPMSSTKKEYASSRKRSKGPEKHSTSAATLSSPAKKVERSSGNKFSSSKKTLANMEPVMSITNPDEAGLSVQQLSTSNDCSDSVEGNRSRAVVRLDTQLQCDEVVDELGVHPAIKGSCVPPRAKQMRDPCGNKDSATKVNFYQSLLSKLELPEFKEPSTEALDRLKLFCMAAEPVGKWNWETA